jgi:hypothetical protein
VKQIPRYNEANLTWMKKEMEKQNIPEFGRHGWLAIDEMTIQDDLIITKSGDTWKLASGRSLGLSFSGVITVFCIDSFSCTCNTFLSC